MDSQGLKAEPVERGGGRGPPLAPLGCYWDARGGTTLAHPLMSPQPPQPVCVPPHPTSSSPSDLPASTKPKFGYLSPNIHISFLPHP